MRQMAQSLDGIDERIVDELTQDGRMSVRALAERLHISRANAYARLQRLTESGTIRGFHAEVDPAALGLGTSAYLTLTLRQSEWRNLRDRLSALPGVAHLALVGGDFDVIMLVRARDNAGLRHLVLEQIQSMEGVLNTRTLLVFDEPTVGDGDRAGSIS
jgi:DNA-binding Lrp family transcriptional regulator